MDYGKMIRDSFALAWRHKSLWILGLFAGWGSGFNTSFGKHDLGSMNGEGLSGTPFGNLSQDPSQIWAWLAPFLVGLAIFAIIYLAMYCIATPGLIDAVNRITRGGAYKLSESFSTGVDFFWRTLGLTILSGMAAVIVFGVVAGLLIVSFKAGVAPFVVTLLFALPVIFMLAVAFACIISLAQRAMVVRNVSIGDAIEEAYLLFRNHLGKNVVFVLINIGLAMGLGIAVAIVALIVYAPIVLVAYSLGLPLWSAFLVAIIISLPVTIPVGGYIGTFQSSLATMFYFGLVEPSGPQMTLPAASEPTPEPIL
jgi:hypothetical protein